jgi:hypothetical protein
MRALIVALALLTAAACADADEASSDSTSTTADRQVNVTTSQPFEPTVGMVPAEKLDPLIADAADRASAAVDSVVVIRAQQVVWSSPALDCPEPGVAYTQVLTNGYWVVLEAGDAEYDYRAEIEGEFRHCVGGAPPSDVLVDR